ncbi:MAG: GDP-mannose 4,6-dehydratase [Lachnospiraceae bacterium]|nr:GDP-mannose 4,6-dehydratase [Lachnospiraceae bacterium]
MSLLYDKTILITGVAGFIGSSLADKILKENEQINIIGIDDLNEYYDIRLKKDRLERLVMHNNFTFVQDTIVNKCNVMNIFERYHPEVVVNLAAQGGVRYSIDHPDVYIESNVVGFYNILEACRYHNVKHLVYASSSSVYGANKKIPYSTSDFVDHPVSLYAATKKTDELFAYTYANLYNIPCTGLRFFTVYGPFGRPDMAYFKFTNKLINGECIELYNYGNCKRDFTYIDDIVTGIVRVICKTPDKDSNGVPYRIYNIGNSRPESLIDFVDILHQQLRKAGMLSEKYDLKRHIKLVPMQPGDVEITYADVSDLERDFDYAPKTTLDVGLGQFVQWYKNYYRI